MAKMHEHLAAEDQVKGEYKKIRDESLKVLGTQHNLLGGKLRILTITKEMSVTEKDTQEKLGKSETALTTTADERLGYHNGFVVARINHRAAKDMTNQAAKADIVLENGVTLMSGAPATFLLSMETFLVEQREVYASIPTLEPGIDWVVDDAHAKKTVYKTRNPATSAKNEKTLKFQSVAKATDKHPEQVEKWHEETPVGYYSDTKFSGAWTAAKKADVLKRCDEVIAAVRQARARANEAVVVRPSGNVGQTFLRFIEENSVPTGA